ncbi:MAG: cation acetate symporter [Planctomycetes bacterium]|nr:cation acetate symporter [Planctomycetota bacterium]
MVTAIFLAFVAFIVGLSVQLGRKTKTSSGYYAAGGQIHWFVNGIAFAGDYLSAASFLGICGLIATQGYDGFLYSIGYLAGWVVALFVIAEPLRRLGRYTFADAVDAQFNSKGIQLAAAISTLVVSLCYLIPQMVGAGVLVEPLLGMPHHWGVIMVGGIVMVIVATAGMASTTYVQFLKGGLLIIFSLVLVVAVCWRGLSTSPDQGGAVPFHRHGSITLIVDDKKNITGTTEGSTASEFATTASGEKFVKLQKEGVSRWWRVDMSDGGLPSARETESVVKEAGGARLVNGMPEGPLNKIRQVGSLASIAGNPDCATGPVSPVGLIAAIGSPETKVTRWKESRFTDAEGSAVTVYHPSETDGSRLLRPGMRFKVQGTWLERLDFASLMLGLFLGTAALPHILIRYYTVPGAKEARKSTIVAIAAIGAFYVLTLFMGLGAMTSGVLNPADSNMAAPLLARSFGDLLFAFISAIAFATVLGTVSGLVVAASGAVAHDLADRYLALALSDSSKIMLGKGAALGVGAVGIALGIVFKGMNVTFLVGLAFAVAGSANLPAIIMILFWPRVTSAGIIASITVGMISSLGLIALCPDMWGLYGLPPSQAPVPFSNPGIVSIPLSFITLVMVSLASTKSAQST